MRAAVPDPPWPSRSPRSATATARGRGVGPGLVGPVSAHASRRQHLSPVVAVMRPGAMSPAAGAAFASYPRGRRPAAAACGREGSPRSAGTGPGPRAWSTPSGGAQTDLQGGCRAGGGRVGVSLPDCSIPLTWYRWEMSLTFVQVKWQVGACSRLAGRPGRPAPLGRPCPGRPPPRLQCPDAVGSTVGGGLRNGKRSHVRDAGGHLRCRSHPAPLGRGTPSRLRRALPPGGHRGDRRRRAARGAGLRAVLAGEPAPAGGPCPRGVVVAAPRRRPTGRWGRRRSGGMLPCPAGRGDVRRCGVGRRPRRAAGPGCPAGPRLRARRGRERRRDGRGGLGALGLADRFAFIADSAVIGARKPDPAIYHAAARAIGVPPGACVHVGDRPDADGGVALAAGATPVLYDPLDVLGGTWRRVLRLAQVLSILPPHAAPPPAAG